MMHKEGEAPEETPTPVEMSLWSNDSNFPGEIDVKGQIGCYKMNQTSISCVLFLMTKGLVVVSWRRICVVKR